MAMLQRQQYRLGTPNPYNTAVANYSLIVRNIKRKLGWN